MSKQLKFKKDVLDFLVNRQKSWDATDVVQAGKYYGHDHDISGKLKELARNHGLKTIVMVNGLMHYIVDRLTERR